MHLLAFRHHSLLRIDAVGSAVCVLASLVWYLTTGGPLLEQRSVTAGLRHELQTQQEKNSALQAAIATVKERLTSVQQELAVGTVQLDSAAHINRRIAGLTGFLSDCELQVDNVQTDRIASGRQYDLVPITIVGRGACLQYVRFLHGLSTTFPDMSVIRVELTGNPAQPSESENFRLQLFWYAAPSGSTPASASEKPRGDAERRS